VYRLRIMSDALIIIYSPTCMYGWAVMLKYVGEVADTVADESLYLLITLISQTLTSRNMAGNVEGG